MAVSVISGSKIKSNSFNATTTGAGTIIIYNKPLANMIILQAWSDNNSSYIVIPFVANNQYWCFKVVNNGDFAPVQNTNLNIYFLYYER